MTDCTAKGKQHNWTPDYLNGDRLCRDCGLIMGKFKSVALQRLIDEVRVDQESGVHPNAYNRVYSRHNRS